MTAARAVGQGHEVVPLPVGFGIELDPLARALTPDLWFGGSPARVLRLTAAGRSSLLRLRAEGVRDLSTGRLARRFTDTGLAHPVPPAAGPVPDVTVLVPVLDRPGSLDACLTALGTVHPVVVVDDGSLDAAAVAGVAARHGARLVRREHNGGPAAARNTGLAVIDTEFVAFVDSDCTPPAGWIDALAGQLADPTVAAVAPRVTSEHGTLDLGPRPGRVVPRSRVAYVPTAALLVRTSALRDIARPVRGTPRGYVFDPALRYGEDVDLVWRLHDAGWRVRYDPAVEVGHRDPATRRGRLARRFRYGTSAAPLGRAHPEAIPALVVHPWAMATVVALLAGRPGPAAAAFTAAVRSTARGLRAADVPTGGTVRAMADAVVQSHLGLGRYLTQFAAPALVAAAAVPGRPWRRLAALSLLLGPALHAWSTGRRDTGPGTAVASHLADEVSYGLGVWAGCVRHRTSVPLRPALMRARPLTHPARPSQESPT